jgi:hypothetical protein
VRRIAISGHRGLAGETSVLVEKAIRAALDEAGPAVTGISCLADGADQIFARAVTDLGGDLEAIIPAGQYRDSLPTDSRSEYDRLLAMAANACCLLFATPTPASFMAAGELMVDTADVLYAVWDGRPARGHGGTADVVAYAYARGTPVTIIWPAGAQRDLARRIRDFLRRACR